jgi:hypothetical protein
VSEAEKPKKKSESAQQLAAAEEAAQARFEKAMTELREGSHRFASKMRGETEIDLEELIDPTATWWPTSRTSRATPEPSRCRCRSI